MSHRLQPALLGGLFIGVLSTLPFVNVVNACCCAWVVGGGMLAAWLLQQNQPEPINAADGLLIGMMAGGIGAVIGTLLSIPVQIFFGPIMRDWIRRLAQGQEMPPGILEMLEQQSSLSVLTVLSTLIFSLVIYVIFAMLGGLLGVAIFKRKTPATP